MTEPAKPTPSPSPAPRVDLGQTEELPPPEPLPIPPPPLPRPPPPTIARRAPPPRAPANPFTPFMQRYTLGEPPGASPNRRPGRGIDLALGNPRPGPTSSAKGMPSDDIKVVSGQANEDWGRELIAWVRARAYYPRQAAENGEDGNSVVEVTIDRYGKVRGLSLVGRSGSMWLDLALQSIFRDATVPAFTPDMTDPTITLDFTMHYILIRR